MKNCSKMQLGLEKKKVNRKLWKRYENLKEKKNKFLNFMKKVISPVKNNCLSF